MLPTNQQQEGLQRAYVRALAARAGVLCGEPREDYGFDLFIRGVDSNAHGYWDSGHQIDLQLKSTIRAAVRGTEIAYDLDVRAYELLRRPTPISSLLLVLALPEDSVNWLEQTEAELLMRGCAYWRCLRGEPSTSNESKIRVTLPRENIFSVLAIKQMMERLREGEQL
jgi:hypothetical protein